jgi:hypothetical protein
VAIHCLPAGSEGQWNVDDAGIDLGVVTKGEDEFRWSCAACATAGANPEGQIRASLDLDRHWVMDHREKLLAGGR